ncbi:hypothetical protein QUF70_20445, partial [Desulfobacterales bacterium HSG17]|nr:hypothetical protein [Desulfobacterales bacterium HSG17]
ELSKEILKIRPDIPIILITGTLFETESELKKTGIRAVLQKPFERRRMYSVIREILETRE